MTTLASSPVFWIGLLAGLGVCTSAHRDRRVQVRGEHRGGGVLELSADFLANRSCRSLHDAGKDDQ
jgi:hypothetical protein